MLWHVVNELLKAQENYHSFKQINIAEFPFHKEETMRTTLYISSYLTYSSETW